MCGFAASALKAACYIVPFLLSPPFSSALLYQVSFPSFFLPLLLLFILPLSSLVSRLSSTFTLLSRRLLLHKINSCPSFLLPSPLLCGRRRASCSLCACRPSAVHPALLLQLSVSPTAYDSQSSDELSSNQSMNFSPSNSAQPLPCFDSGPSPARSSPGASRQVSANGRGGCRHRVLNLRPVMATKYVTKSNHPRKT